jgi:polyhydroxyalkanoate synthase
MNLLKGERRFVLGASGHIAGIINPPSKNKRSYWELEDKNGPVAYGPGDGLGAKGGAAEILDVDQWQATATEHPGSWWTPWSTWLSQHAGKLIAAPRQPGNAAHLPIEPAPGRYVKRRL